ncbi:MAG TPA: hypothetical protein VFR78_11360 [Pyrinomonadaceae bacterium]|nr:hypothetical protein [Pyrinomonadaceae bacterium]
MKKVFPILLVLLCCVGTSAQESVDEAHVNSMAELRDKRSALLVVFKSRVLDVNDRDSAIIQDVLKADPYPKGRYRWVYAQLAQKLNKYIRKYKSLTAATDLSDADYVIFFNVVEFRRILNTPYPFGELFVIVKGSPETLTPPRVVWKAKKMLFAEDAIGAFIRDLKALRGEG